MSPFVPPPQFVVQETDHWLINHRCDTRYPGYLMVGAKDADGLSLPDLCPEALAELGGLLARCTAALREGLGAQRVYVCRYGHDAGHTVHFHVVPLYQWTLDLFVADDRAARLQMFHAGRRRHIDFPPYTEPDGNDLMLFINRLFAERGVQPPEIEAPGPEDVVSLLRASLNP